MTGRAAGAKASNVPTEVGLEGPLAFARDEVESFIRAAFLTAYDADVRHFMPQLMTLRDTQGALMAALGLRGPDAGPLFLEYYLDRPAEQALAAVIGRPVARSQLVEVGNFAVGAAGGGRWLITALTAFLHGAGSAWAVFTCGPGLRNSFRRLGIPLYPLAEADPDCLSPDERSRWGRYYDQHPMVMVAGVAESHAALTERLVGETALLPLWQGALRAGRVAA
jgi:hypothetical protein